MASSKPVVVQFAMAEIEHLHVVAEDAPHTELPNETISSSHLGAPDVETPLPKLQLFILLYLQLAEPITSTVIYPFVNQLVRETGITGGDERKTGYFAGLIVRRCRACRSDKSLTIPGVGAGIVFLRRRGDMCTAMGPPLRPHRAQTRPPRGRARPHGLHARLWGVAAVLGDRAQPLRGGRAEREHRRHEEHDGGDHGPHEPRARVRVSAHDMVGWRDAWVSVVERVCLGWGEAHGVSFRLQTCYWRRVCASCGPLAWISGLGILEELPVLPALHHRGLYIYQRVRPCVNWAQRGER